MIDPSLFTLPYDRSLALELARLGHSVTLHARPPGFEDGDAAGLDLRADFYPVTAGNLDAWPRPLRLGVKGVEHVMSMARLRRRLSAPALRPDVIHVMWLPLPLADRGFLPGLRAIAPLVLTLHDSNPLNGEPGASAVMRAGMVRCYAAFDRLIVHTRQGEERLRAQGVPAARIARLPHAVPDAPQVTPASGPDAFAGDVTLVLFGKIKHYKGADLLIEAFARVPYALRRRARLRIIGKPYVETAPLLALADRLGMAERLSFEARFVPDAEIPSLFGPGVVAVFPYREIEASGVLPMALAAGRPIVASRLGAFGEWLEDGRQGLLVPAGDVAALARALERMLDDRAFASRCAQEARELFTRLPGWAEIARGTVEVYEAARASHRLAA
jgi:glycosyltransferase involved in cell wall biosynthesis